MYNSKDEKIGQSNTGNKITVFEDGKIMLNGNMRGLEKPITSDHHRFVRTNIDREQQLGNANPDVFNSDNRDPFYIISDEEERTILEENLYLLA